MSFVSQKKTMLLVRDKKNHGKFPGGEVSGPSPAGSRRSARSVVAMGHGALGVSYGEPQNPICTYIIYICMYTPSMGFTVMGILYI